MIRHIIKGHSYPHDTLKSVKRIITLGVVAFTILILSTVFAGYLVNQEITLTYVENYKALTEAGVVDVIASPQVVSDRILLLITIIPMIGAGIVFPILLFAVSEINKLIKYSITEEELRTDDPVVISLSDNFVDDHIARNVSIAQGRGN